MQHFPHGMLTRPPSAPVLPEKGSGEPALYSLIRTLAEQADVVLLGDTRHDNPDIKKLVAGLLPAAKAHGATKLWLEVDHKHEKALEDYLTHNPAASGEELGYFLQDATKLRSSAALGSLVRAALDEGIKPRFFDDKTPADAVRKAFPRYRELRAEVKARIDEGGLEARDAYLNRLKPEVRMEYETAYRAWKEARDTINPSIADLIADCRAEHGGKALVLIGSEHMNKPTDLDELLAARGQKVAHVDLYASERDCLDDIRRIVHETGKGTNIPDYAYFMRENRIATADEIDHALKTEDMLRAAERPDPSVRHALHDGRGFFQRLADVLGLG